MFFCGVFLKELPKAKEDTNKVKLLNELSYSYVIVNPAKGIKKGMDELLLAENLHWQIGIGMANASIGENYYSKADYPMALDYLFKALKVNEEIKNKKNIATVLMNIGTVYWRQNDTVKPLEYYSGSLKIREDGNDKKGIAEIMSLLGNVYIAKGDYVKAIEEYNKASKEFEELDDKMSLANVTGNIGNIYFYRNNIPMSLVYFFKGLRLNEAAGNIDGTTLNFGNIGAAYASIALDTNRIIAADSLIPKKRKANLYKALEYTKKAIELSRKTGNENYLQMFLNNLSEIQSKGGDYKNSLKTFKEYITIKDSVFNRLNTIKIDSLQMQYNYDKKEAAIQAANDKKIESKKAQLRIFIIIGMASLVILFLSFYFYRKRENDKFNLQILEVKQEALNAQMSDHFIGNTMSSINGFIKNNEKEKASEYLILFSRLIRKVLENAAQKLIPLEEDLDILKNYLELEKLQFATGEFQYEIRLESEINRSNALIPPMVFQVLAENAIKHGFRKTIGGKLLLKVDKKDNIIECTVEDNGIGRDAATLEKQEDTSQKSKSYGSILAEKLVKVSGKYLKQTSYKIIDLFDNNNKPAGTRVVFTLPYILAE